MLVANTGQARTSPGGCLEALRWENPPGGKVTSWPPNKELDEEAEDGTGTRPELLQGQPHVANSDGFRESPDWLAELETGCQLRRVFVLGQF